MDAASIGLLENQLVLGKHSGRHAFRSRLQELGFELSETDLNKAFLRFRQVAEKLIEYSVQSVTGRIDALETVIVRIQQGDQICAGQASDTDIVVASAHAYLNALNRLYRSQQTVGAPQVSGREIRC